MADPVIVLILCRGAIFGAALMIWGASLFRWRLQPPAERMRFEGWMILCLVVAVFILLPAQAARVSDGWGDIFEPGLLRDVIVFTTPGRSWALQAAAITVAAFAFVMQWTRATVLSIVIVFIAQSMTGHAAASEGVFGYVRQANDVLHQIAAGAWLGALPYVLRLLPDVEKLDAKMILIRYSGEGHFWVSLLLVTGLIATLWIFEGIPLDWSIRYQLLWALKVFVTMAMVGLAVCNRYFLVPRLRDRPDALSALARATRLEIALGLLAVALVAWFGTLEQR